MLGYVALRQGDVDGAIAAFNEYVRILPQEPNPQDSLGEALLAVRRTRLQPHWIRRPHLRLTTRTLRHRCTSDAAPRHYIERPSHRAEPLRQMLLGRRMVQAGGCGDRREGRRQSGSGCCPSGTAQALSTRSIAPGRSHTSDADRDELMSSLSEARIGSFRQAPSHGFSSRRSNSNRCGSITRTSRKSRCRGFSR